MESSTACSKIIFDSRVKFNKQDDQAMNSLLQANLINKKIKKNRNANFYNNYIHEQKRGVTFKDPLIEYVNIQSYKIQNSFIYRNDIYKYRTNTQDKSNILASLCKDCLIF